MNTKKCIVLIGVPAAGKSTWLELYADKPCAVVSTDNILEGFASEEGITYDESFAKYAKVVTPMMWKELDTRIEEEWETIIVDRSNMSVKARKLFFERVKGKGYEFHAVVFPIPEKEEWDRRLSSRPGKTIPQYVLDSMVQSFEMPIESEGFETIITILKEKYHD